MHDVGKPATRTTDEDGVDHFYGHPTLGSELARKILKRLRFDNETIDRVSLLIVYHDYGNSVSATPVFTRKLINKVHLDNFPMLLDIKYADVMAQSELQRDSKLVKLEQLRTSYQDVLDQGMCISLKSLAVTGRDLIQAGMKPGQEIGQALNHLLEVVLEDPDMNDKGSLMELIKRWGYI